MVSRLCILVTASMKDLFFPITVSPLSVILQCFIIYVV